MSLALETQASSEASFLGLIRRQLARPKPLPNLRLAGQYAVVTGSNTGIGFHAARHLLSRGLSHLVVAVRSQTRGDEAAAKLRKEFPASTVSVSVVDMESYDSVQQFASRCAQLPRLDIVILNAGLLKASFATAASGREGTIQVNYLSTALLAILFLPVLEAQKQSGRTATLSLVGSDIVYSKPIETSGPVLSRFDNPKEFAQPRWYGLSKLLLTLFVWKLAEAVDMGVVINMVNPGMTGGTGFFSTQPFIIRKAMAVIQFIMGARKPEVAATTYIDGISQGSASHGSFLSEWTIKP